MTMCNAMRRARCGRDNGQRRAIAKISGVNAAQSSQSRLMKTMLPKLMPRPPRSARWAMLSIAPRMAGPSQAAETSIQGRRWRRTRES